MRKKKHKRELGNDNGSNDDIGITETTASTSNASQVWSVGFGCLTDHSCVVHPTVSARFLLGPRRGIPRYFAQ